MSEGGARKVRFASLNFDDEQMSALADYVQSALMLNYNQRAVG